MVCVTNLTVVHALKYFDDDIRRQDGKVLDYYAQEDYGMWFGLGAHKLGLDNKKFCKEDYQNIMLGKFVYFDKALGQDVSIDLQQYVQDNNHHPGIEITLSAPKSVSIMAEVFKDNRIREAHSRAINNVMDYIQNNFIYTRCSKYGDTVLEKVDNLLSAKFTHHINRNHDPQLHTHIVIANVIFDKNGKIKTAEHSMVFRSERFIRALYNNELAHELIKLGYNIEWQKKVTQTAPEIKGVPSELILFFSTRSKEIDDFIANQKLDPLNMAARQLACIATRSTKNNNIGIDDLDPIWFQKVRSCGIDIDNFRAKICKNDVTNLKILQSPISGELSTLIRNSIIHITEHNATFTQEELILSVIDRTKGSYNLSSVAEYIQKNTELIKSELKLIEYCRHLNLYDSRVKTVYTTKTQINIENRVSKLIMNGIGVCTSLYEIGMRMQFNDYMLDLLYEESLGKNLYNTLNVSQRGIIDFVLHNKDRFLAIQGYAGVGKTYTIRALNEKLKLINITLLGLAPTHSAVQTLKKEANIGAITLQSFVSKYNGYAYDREINSEALKILRNLYKNKIILVDESSLVGSKQMLELLAIATKFETRVILQGDKKQLCSVESGTPFVQMINENIIKYGKLDNIVRQREKNIKSAVYDIIREDIICSFNRLASKNAVIELRTNEEVERWRYEQNVLTDNGKLDRVNYDRYLEYLRKTNLNEIKKDLTSKVVDLYSALDTKQRNNTIIITSSNEIKVDINEQLRKLIKKENKDKGIDNLRCSVILEVLLLKSLTKQEKTEIANYKIGESIIFLAKNKQCKIHTKDEYNIIHIDKNKNELYLQKIGSPKGKYLVINVKTYGRVINVFTRENRELIINDKIKFTTTNKERNIFKDDAFMVKSIDQDNKLITISHSHKNNDLVINLNIEDDKKLMRYIDYNYSTTTYSAQGKTSLNVIYTLESYRPILTTQKDFYVGLSRAKDNITIITDNLKKSIKTLLNNNGERLFARDILNALSLSSNKKDNLEISL